MDEPLQDEQPDKTDEGDALSAQEQVDKPIATWTYCLQCKKVVSPLTYISDNTWVRSYLCTALHEY